jgi:Cu2+-containing amine oxidase
MSEAGSIVWPSTTVPLWRLDWRLADSPDQEGIVISSALFQGRKVFHKASLPSLRVQYDGPCGPYKDPLNYNNAQPTQACPNSRVCTRTIDDHGFRGLVIESYHRIGSYRLTHRWIFWQDGLIMPRLLSAGLQCNYNHRHHAYWRFDFDIEGASNDLVLEYNTYTANQGWGPGWQPLTAETARTKNPPSQRQWAVLEKSSRRGFQIIPRAGDGFPDAFSTRDFWLMRYHAEEDLYGRQGSASSDGLDAYLNNEGVDGQDLVAWYCGHLSHVAAHGGDDWHACGPDLRPFGPW